MILSRLFLLALVFVFASCSVQRQLGKTAGKLLLQNEALRTAHVGIAIYDPASAAYLYQFQGDKYFVPASNTKIATCYAALRYLGDSIPALYYREEGDSLLIEATGDPTFLHPQFPVQKAFAWLLASNKPIYLSLDAWKAQPWGSGWSWNDYDEPYMAERSAMPIYGNVMRVSGRLNALQVSPSYFSTTIIDTARQDLFASSVSRSLTGNDFTVKGGGTTYSIIEKSFYTAKSTLIFDLLRDTLKKPVYPWTGSLATGRASRVVYAQHIDSVLLPMMHNSDNFLAEQLLMMVSRKQMGIMHDAIVDSILRSGLNDLPQRPRWVDGSGLSRYNLFTPQSMVQLLDRMHKDHGMERLQVIFPSGNEGTLRNYYAKDSGFVFAKTGTLSGVVALSGYLVTARNRRLIFSILINNHQAASATLVRRAVESFLSAVRQKY